MMKNYSSVTFGLFRIVFGIYLLVHFIQLLPYSTEIWSNKGILPHESLNLTYGFPNLLNQFDNPIHITITLYVLCVCSFILITGFQRQFIAIILWLGWVFLFNRNNLISNPSIPFVGWLLLCCIVIPKGEKFTVFSIPKSNWEIPKTLLVGAWIILSLSYTISGIDKLNAPSWANGDAIYYLLQNPLARNWDLRTFFLLLPKSLLKGITYTILFIEISFCFFAIFQKTRKHIWLAMIFVHLGILLLVDFADLTIGMLMIHFFTFDYNWIKKPYKNLEL